MSDGERGSERAVTSDDLESPLVPFAEGEFFEQLVANTSEGLLTIDEQSTIVFANPAIEDILGYGPEELIGRPKTLLIPERLESAHLEGLQAYCRTGEKHIDWDGIELPAVHKDGHEVPVLVSLREHTHEGQQLFTGLFRDLSGRKTRQRRFEAVFNNTYQFTGLLEPDGTVLEANETALSFGGLDREEVVGTPLWETYWFQLSEEARETALEGVECASNGELFQDEIRVQGADRTAIIALSIRPVRDHTGEIQVLIPEGRDITALKLREQHLRVLHRLFRHNLRNELNVISGVAETLVSELEDETHCEYASEILHTAAGLVEMTETAKQLADGALEDGGQQAPIEVLAVLRDVVDDLQVEYPESSIRVADAAATTVAADSRLYSVFEEVIHNAITYSDEEQPTVDIAVLEQDETVAVRVFDTGPGIPDAERTGVFNDERITQVKHGSGLGLSLASLIVDDYGGSLEYERRPDGAGSCVTVVLPQTE